MTNIIGTLLMSLSLFIVSRGYLGQIKGLIKWAAATGIQCIGWFFLSALRGAVPDLISIVVGNCLLLLSLGLYSNILAEFNNKPPRRFLTYLLVSLAAIILAYFVLIRPDVSSRIVIISGGSAIFLFASSYILLSTKGHRPVSHLLTAILFTICGTILTFRFFYTLIADPNPGQTPFGTYPMQNISFLTFFIISVMLTFGFVLMCNDRYILERKQVEEELIVAKRLAEALAGAKDRFLSNMSHEIRTPLNGIIGFTTILLQSDLPPNQKKQIEIIKTSGNILMALINDILDLAKINDGKVELEETVFNLSDLVNDILISFELRINEKEIKMVKMYDENIPNLLIGDPIRISQILINLINNSNKFTNNGGQIKVDVSLVEQDEEKAIIEFNISDTGIGISKEKLKTIFEPFVQGNNGSAYKHEGTGLGLGIVKRLINLMNGTICIEGKLNEGTTVTVIIPLKKTETILVPEKTETILLSDDLKEIGHLKVLIADDNEINQLLAQTILLKFGFEVDSAENGKIAIELMNKNQYDIILMDLKMPEMGGFEAAQHIRTQMDPPKSTVPIIAITADVTKADLDTFKEAGINDFILKPFDQADLLNKITALVKKSKTKK
ncbi:MAG: response regulator [Bacteroidota bacterium]